jgi:hypothetical protein
MAVPHREQSLQELVDTNVMVNGPQHSFSLPRIAGRPRVVHIRRPCR